MPFLLRKIRKARWDRTAATPYLERNDIPADPLGDLATKENVLSVWHIEEDKANLERVVTAVAVANVDTISNFDFLLFDYQVLDQINIKIKAPRGTTADETVNTSWHRDLVELSALKLVALAKGIFTTAQKERIPEKKVGELVAKALVNGQIEKSKLAGNVVAKLPSLSK